MNTIENGVLDTCVYVLLYLRFFVVNSVPSAPPVTRFSLRLPMTSSFVNIPSFLACIDLNFFSCFWTKMADTSVIINPFPFFFCEKQKLTSFFIAPTQVHGNKV